MKSKLITVIIIVAVASIGFVTYNKLSSKTANASTVSNQENGVISSSKDIQTTVSKKDTSNLTPIASAKDNKIATNNINENTTSSHDIISSSKKSAQKVQTQNTNKSPLVYGETIPGTNEISYNIIEKHGTVYPQNANEFFSVNKELSSPLIESNITISGNTPYTKYSGESSLFNYYIIAPYHLNNGPYQITKNLDANNPDKTNFNNTGNNLTAIGYIQGGVIVTTNSNGETVYVSAKSIKTPITFKRGDLQYFVANATINTDNTVQVRSEPALLPTFNTIGNQISEKGLNVVAIAQVNSFTKIIFGTNKGIFCGWIPSDSLSIENNNFSA